MSANNGTPASSTDAMQPNAAQPNAAPPNAAPPALGQVEGTAARRGHMPALDGMRGAAVLLVMAHNINAIDNPSQRSTRLYDIVMGWGWVGVLIFFVLSGFLITGILMDTRQAAGYYRSFIARRALRIFPLYYAVLLAVFVLLPAIVGFRPQGSEHQVWLWTYLANWAAPFGREVAGFTHFWSLAIEEQFYLIWPLVVLWLSPRGLLKLCGLLCVVALATRIGLLLIHFDKEGPYMFTFCRVDGLAFGAGAAVLFRRPAVVARYQQVRERAGAKGMAGVIVVLLATIVLTRGAPRTGVLTQSFGYTVFGLVAAGLVFDAALAAPKSSVLVRLWYARGLRNVGKFSYAMYVFHLPLHLFWGMPMLKRLLAGAPVTVPIAGAYYAAMSLLVYLLSALSYHLFEKHLLRLKRHFVVKPAAAA